MWIIPRALQLLVVVAEVSSIVAGEDLVSGRHHHQRRQHRRYEDVDNGLRHQTNEPLQTLEYFEEGDIDRNVDEYDDDDDDGDGGRYWSDRVPSRGLVPQLWPNYTGIPEPEPESVSCDVARQKCALRAGCGLALQNYALGCADLAQGTTEQCNTHCKHSLIAIMSTHEGQRLMKCNCSGDAFCETSKRNIAACRDEVLPIMEADSVVSCSAAQWICAADPLCATALRYYNHFCGAMFRGRTCTDRCLNSIQILRRQAAAPKLESCQCDGPEKLECQNMKDNMARLCFPPDNEVDDNSVDGDSGGRVSAADRFLLLVSVVVTIVVSLIRESISHAFAALAGSPAN